MEKINVLTWNVDWCRNGARSGRPEEYFEEDSSLEIYNSIKKIIIDFLKKENSIVFLQEMPFKAKGIRWHNHFLYKQMYKDFPKKEYEIFVNEEFSYRCTVAISKKDIFKEARIGNLLDNRTVAVRKGAYVFIGTHMPTGFIENDDNCKKWDALSSYLKNDNNAYVFGDFNVYIGCKDKQTEKKYLDLLKLMVNCVDEKDITYIGNTSIDKVLRHKDESRIKVEKIELQTNFELSDHKYLCIELLSME